MGVVMLITAVMLASLLHPVSASGGHTRGRRATACNDDPNFRRKGKPNLNCEKFLQKDTDKRCGWKEEGIPIRDICRATCGTPCQTQCNDDPNFRRKGKANLNCEKFLKNNTDKKCGWKEEGIPIRDICRATCGTPCQTPEGGRDRAAAMARPSRAAPTPASPTPSPSFELRPWQCHDDPNFRRKGKANLNCGNFLQKNTDKKCGRKEGGIAVRDICRATCGTCNHVSWFVDISAKLAEYASDIHAHPLVLKPWSHWHGPMTFDVNGDGFPDMLSHHHVLPSKKYSTLSLGGHLWDLATSSVNNANEVAYTAGKVDVTYEAHIPDTEDAYWDINQGRRSERGDVKQACIKEYNMTDGYNLTDGSISDPWACLNYHDFHGTIVLDFDRDGKLDAFVTVGGGNGLGLGLSVESMLFWGLHTPGSQSTTVPQSDLHFVGGRGALRKAGLSSGKPQRTYGVYAADFNNDGYLDFFPINKYRKDLIDAPGLIYINQGASDPRLFDAHLEVSEYATAALLTDFDQDGFANEFLILQRTCADSDIVIDINTSGKCIENPKAVVYKWDTTLDAFAQIWASAPWGVGTTLESMASGDFNGDGFTDIVILVKRAGGERATLQFWHSTISLDILGSVTAATLIVTIPPDCTPRHSIRAADFDLDGRLDLFVLCKEGAHKMFQQAPSGGKWSVVTPAALGPLGVPKENKKSTQAYFDRCFGNGPEQCESDAGELEMIKGRIGTKMNPKYQGVTVFDHNNDGFVDIFLAYRGGLSTLYQNTGVPGNKFVSFKLKGTASNVDGIGANVLLTWSNGVGSEEKYQLREHNAQSFEADCFGSRESRIIFGLGNTGVPLKLEVRWPSGRVSTLTAAELGSANRTMHFDKIMTITEPELVPGL